MMGNKPKVSVIVPVFNAGTKLVPSIESLLKQTLKDIEIIIVNDASTDDTVAVISELAKKNDNIVPIHFTENRGVHEARLAGLKRSTAPWIGFLDADDFARPKMFEVMLSSANSHGVDIIVCGSDRVTLERKVVGRKLRFNRSKKVTSNVFDRFCCFEFGTGMLWNKLFKRKVIEPFFDFYFPWKQSINEDLLLNIGCFSHASSVFLLKDVLYEYVISENSITNKMEKKWAYVEIFRAYAIAVTFYKYLGKGAILKIADMYARQMCWSCYKLNSNEELYMYQSKLEEASNYICSENPFALVAIISSHQRVRVDFKRSIKSILALILEKVNFFRILF